MVPSTPWGLLAGSKRELLLYLLGIHAQQSFTNWHFIPWSIWSPSPETLVPHHYCGEPPCTHSLHSSSQLDTHKVLVHRKSKHKSPRAALWQAFIGSGAAYSFAKSANQLQALYLLYIGISASHSSNICNFVSRKNLH